MARKRALSEYASLAMIILGLVTFLFVYPLAGLILMVLGVAMNIVYRWHVNRKYFAHPPTDDSEEPPSDRDEKV